MFRWIIIVHKILVSEVCVAICFENFFKCLCFIRIGGFGKVYYHKWIFLVKVQKKLKINLKSQSDRTKDIL